MGLYRVTIYRQLEEGEVDTREELYEECVRKQLQEETKKIKPTQEINNNNQQPEKKASSEGWIQSVCITLGVIFLVLIAVVPM